MVMVLAKVLDAQVRHLILALDVVDADLALLHRLLYEKISQRDVLCARTIGTIVGDVQRRRVIDIKRYAAEAIIETQLQYHVGAKHCTLHCQS